MTKEEAIELIHDIQTDAVYSILPEEKEALDMAISALSENKGDLISRNGVLARVRLNFTNHQTVERHEIEDIIKSEPLAENKGRTYGEVINFYLNGLVETYKRMGYTITEISITEKNWLSPLIYEFWKMESGGKE